MPPRPPPLTGHRTLLPARTPGRARPEIADERGSQAVEFAMVMPIALCLLSFLLGAAGVGAELVAAQHLVREVVRVAVVDGDDAAHAAARGLAEGRELRLTLTPASGARQVGDPLTGELSLRSGLAGHLGVDLWLPARAVMHTEDVP